MNLIKIIEFLISPLFIEHFILIFIFIILSIYLIRLLSRGSLMNDIEDVKSLATTAGMLGTFIGIAVGLYSFDPNNIDASVPKLLGGLRTAFYSSIAGLIISLIASIFPSLFIKISDEDGKQFVSTEEKVLHSILEEQKKLNESFNNFASKITQQNIDALTEAINRVLKDFNTTINEKLGKAFEDFKVSVENLNSWQKEYKDNIEATHMHLNSLLTQLKTVLNELEAMSKTYLELQKVVQQFENMVGDLNAHLKKFYDLSNDIGDLSNELKGAGSDIKQEIRELIGSAVKELEQANNRILTEFGSNLVSISNKLAEDFRKVQEALKIDKT